MHYYDNDDHKTFKEPMSSTCTQKKIKPIIIIFTNDLPILLLVQMHSSKTEKIRTIFF